MKNMEKWLGYFIAALFGTHGGVAQLIALGILGLLVCLAIVFFIRLGSKELTAIQSYVESRGGKIISIIPEEPMVNIMTDRNSRYHVQYQDSMGNIVDSDCKIGLLGPVYFTNTVVTQTKEMCSATPSDSQKSFSENYVAHVEQEMPRDPVSVLREENKALKEELALLRSRLQRYENVD